MPDQEELKEEVILKKEGAYPNITLALYCFGILITGVFLGITISLKLSPQINSQSEALKAIPPSFATAVRTASPSVVNVDAKMQFYTAEHKDSREQKEENKDVASSNTTSQQQGCGIIIGGVDGDQMILTSNHVVPSGFKIRVTTLEKKEYDAQMVGSDSYTDLAVIKIHATNLPIAKLGDPKILKQGDPCIAIGSPLGYDQSVSSGVISALDRTLHLDHHVNFIQTDAGVGPGNSGGPLVNTKGEVIGILSKAVLSNQRIQLAVPIDVAMSVAQSLINNKKVSRPFLGIYFKDILENPKAAHTLNVKPIAVSVGNLVPGSPAQKCGIATGDVIKSADDNPVISAQEVRAILKSKKVGDKLKLEIARNKLTIKKIIQLEEYPANL